MLPSPLLTVIIIGHSPPPISSIQLLLPYLFRHHHYRWLHPISCRTLLNIHFCVLIE